MISSSFKNIGLLAALAGMLLVGCGSPTTAARLGGSSGSDPNAVQWGARDAEVGPETNMMNLNATGELDALEDEDILSLDPEAASADSVADEGLFGKKKTPEAAKVKTVSKVGFVRSNTDGKFFLQVSKGFLWWKRESSIPLAADENTSLKVAGALNKKVFLRGPQQGETVAVKTIIKLLDFGVVWDLLSKGSVAGKVYDARTKVGLSFAEITVKSFATGRMWRTKSAEDGAYKVGRLDAGEYEITAWSADFTLGAKDRITVKKRSSAKAHLGLALQSQAGATAPPPVK